MKSLLHKFYWMNGWVSEYKNHSTIFHSLQTYQAAKISRIHLNACFIQMLSTGHILELFTVEVADEE